MTLLLEDPVLDIALISLGLMIFTFTVRKLVTDQDKMDSMKEKQKQWSKKYKEVMKTGDQEKIKKVNAEYAEVMKLFKDGMNENFKSLLYTMLPVLGVFWLLKDTYDGTGIIIELPIIGGIEWFWWYLIIAISSSIIFENIYQVIRKQIKKNKFVSKEINDQQTK